MAWFFDAKCPVDAEMKKWLESCFCWLIKEFGEEVIRETLVVLPTEEFFPDKFSTDHADIQALFETVCEYMETSAEKFELFFYEDQTNELKFKLPFYESSKKGAAGFYREEDGKYIVALKTGKQINPENLIATMAHEIAHAKLLGEKRISSENKNHEYLADLLTVIFGMGIFNANSVFNFEQYTSSSKIGWEASRQGYLNEEMFGYALAMFAFVRREKSPEWAKFLKTGVKHYFKKSLQFLLKTKDTTLKSFTD